VADAVAEEAVLHADADAGGVLQAAVAGADVGDAALHLGMSVLETGTSST
jgi:hypothetical protein